MCVLQLAENKIYKLLSRSVYGRIHGRKCATFIYPTIVFDVNSLILFVQSYYDPSTSEITAKVMGKIDWYQTPNKAQQFVCIIRGVYYIVHVTVTLYVMPRKISSCDLNRTAKSLGCVSIWRSCHLTTIPRWSYLHTKTFYDEKSVSVYWSRSIRSLDTNQMWLRSITCSDVKISFLYSGHILDTDWLAAVK